MRSRIAAPATSGFATRRLATAHLGVAGGRAPREALSLHLARGDDAHADRGRALAGGGVGELAVADGGDVDVQIDAVEQRTGEAGAVVREGVRRAAADAGRIAAETAGVSPRCLFIASS